MKKKIMLALGLTFALTSSVVPAFAFTTVTSTSLPATVIPISNLLEGLAVPTVQGSTTTTTSGSLVKSANVYLNVRTSPSTSSSKITVLSPGQQVTVLEANVSGSGWDKISVSGQTGYAYNTYLSTVSTPTTTTTQSAQGAVVTYGAAQDSGEFTQFSQGYKFNLQAEVESIPIYNLELDGVLGFVMAGDIVRAYDTDDYVSNLGFTLVAFEGKLGYASTQDFNFSRTNAPSTR